MRWKVGQVIIGREQLFKVGSDPGVAPKLYRINSTGGNRHLSIFAYSTYPQALLTIIKSAAVHHIFQQDLVGVA